MKCDICKNEMKENIYNMSRKRGGGRIKIYKCPVCKLYFQSSRGFDNSNSDYIDWNYREIGLRHLREKNYIRILSAMNKLLDNNAVGLEIGSAYGWFLELVNKKYTCYGIEADSKNISDNSGYKVFKGFFPEELPEGIKNLDFIIFNDVIEHIPDCNYVVESCAKRIKTGGYLIINVPLSTGVLFRIASHLNWFGRIGANYLRLWQIRTNSPHIYYFNNKNIKLLGEKHGFSEICHFKLDTLDKDTIYERIATVEGEKGGKIKAKILKILHPLFSILPNDTGVIILKKDK